ncbi:MAG TPA: site-specific integrase [Stellaceae bacterium]|nr:site-specific integrase [Stellaceae bacterium]
MGVYKRAGSHHWYIRFQNEGRDIVRAASSCATRKEAEGLLKQLKAQFRAKKLGIVVDGNLDEALAEWIERGDQDEAAPGKVYGLKPSSWARYKVSVGQISRLTEGAMISDVCKAWVGMFVETRQDEGVANRTIRRDLDALSAFFQWLQGKSRVEHNRVRDYDIGNIPELKTEIRVPSISEIQTIIDTFHRMAASIVAFMALTGLRLGEVLALEWNEIDLITGILIVVKSKSTNPRTVHLFKSAIELLQSLPKPPDHATAPRGGFVFWHDEGLPYRQFGTSWWQVVHELLGSPVRDHDLRHFYAWLYLRRGGSIAGLKSQLGHADIATTDQYAKIADDLAHWDLVVMGERKPDIGRAQFDVRFSFGKCGPFLSRREAQARSRKLFATIRNDKRSQADVESTGAHPRVDAA